MGDPFLDKNWRNSGYRNAALLVLELSESLYKEDNLECPNFSINESNSEDVFYTPSCSKTLDLASEIREDYKDAFETVNVINTLYKLTDERRKSFEASRDACMKLLVERSADVMNFNELGEKIRKVEELNSHLSKIIKEAHQLKQKLKNDSLQDSWNIHISFHRYVAQFCHLVTELLNNLSSNSDSIHWISNRDLEESFTLDPLFMDIKKRVAELHNTLNLLTEYHSSLLRLFALSSKNECSGDEIGNSDGSSNLFSLCTSHKSKH